MEHVFSAPGFLVGPWDTSHFQGIALGNMQRPSPGIAESYGNCTFNFGGIALLSPQQVDPHVEGVAKEVCCWVGVGVGGKVPLSFPGALVSGHKMGKVPHLGCGQQGPAVLLGRERVDGPSVGRPMGLKSPCPRSTDTQVKARESWEGDDSVDAVVHAPGTVGTE